MNLNVLPYWVGMAVIGAAIVWALQTYGPF